MKFLLMLALAVGGGAYWWVNHSLTLAAPTLDLSVEPGTTPRGVAQLAVDSGVHTSPMFLYWWFRLSGQARLIKAGSYELETGLTPYKLLSKLTRGEESLRSVTLVEGWTFRQVRAALLKEEQLRPDAKGLDDAVIMEKLGLPGRHPEGRFYPDTYTYAKGSSDLQLLLRANHAMDKHLAQAWQARAANSPL